MKLTLHSYIASAIVLISIVSTSASNVFYTFDSDGVLPSSQGATFRGSGPESSAFSVNSGLLTLNTSTVWPAAYQVANAYDSNYDTMLEWRMKTVSSSGPDFGPEITLRAAPFSWTFAIQGTYISQYDGNVTVAGGSSRWWNIGSFSAGDFHTFKIVIPAHSMDFNLFIDGTLLYSGTAQDHDDIRALNVNSLYWGEGLTSSHSQNLSQWDYIQLQNVPEPNPGGLILLGGGIFVFMRSRLFRKP